MNLDQLLEATNSFWYKKRNNIFERIHLCITGPPKPDCLPELIPLYTNRSLIDFSDDLNMALIDDAMDIIFNFVTSLGLVPKVGIRMIFWDPDFPLPAVEELAGRSELRAPMTIMNNSTKSITILLPTKRNGTRTGSYGEWLISTIVHEGWHGLLWSALGFDALHCLRRSSHGRNWSKFEEMCAGMLEYKLAFDSFGWLEYGLRWRASFSMSMSEIDWIAAIEPEIASPRGSVNNESYGHFPFLAWVDEQRKSHETLPDSWLFSLLNKGLSKSWRENPWAILDEELGDTGGLEFVYTQYIKDAYFSQSSHIISTLINKIGPPAVLHIAPGDDARIFSVGPLGVQAFSVTASKNSVDLVIVIPEGSHCDVHAMWKSGIAMEDAVICRDVLGKEIHWRLKISSAPAENSNLIVLVQSAYNGQGVIGVCRWQPH